MSEWKPRTKLGYEVSSGKVTSLQNVLLSGRAILESEIIDILEPQLKDEILERRRTQRVTAAGRKTTTRVVIIVGNMNHVVGLGVGKAKEYLDAIKKALKDAKMHLVYVPLGCGSWECGCGKEHSILFSVSGKEGSTQITLKPAPKGTGIVANKVTAKVLEFAGIKDCRSLSKGRTKNKLNTALATIDALKKLSSSRVGKRSTRVKK